MMPTIDLDQLTAGMNEQQMRILGSDLDRKFSERFGSSLFTAQNGEHNDPPTVLFMTEEEENSEFVKEHKRRMADPNQKLLTVDEFLAAITRK